MPVRVLTHGLDDTLPEEGHTVAIIGLAVLLITWVLVYSLTRISASADAAVEQWDDDSVRRRLQRGA
ncbi:MAG: hypothetical protein ACP5KN_01875 [Armatimonadota bacterium]